MLAAEGREDIVKLYREFDAKCAEEYDRIHNRRNYEEELFVPTPSAREERERAYRQLLSEALELPEPTQVFSLLKAHFQEFIEGQLSAMNTTFARPGRFVDRLTSFLDFMARKDSRAAHERFRLVLRRLSLVDDLWSGIRTLLSGADRKSISELGESCSMLARVAGILKTRVRQYFSGLEESSIDELCVALDKIGEKARAWEREISGVLEGRAYSGGPKPEDEKDPLSPEEYGSILEKEFGVDINELLSWYDDEVSATREEMFDIASRINFEAGTRPRDVQEIVAILNKHAGPCDTPDEMFRRLRMYMDRAQAAARQLVNLPEEHCRVAPVPEQYRGHYPWGGYGGGCPRRRPVVGEVFLNDTNYRAITDGWIKINAVHECYPGHHVQFVRTAVDPLPETVKIGARGVPLLEGMCVRSERLMEPVFSEDPYYALFVAYRRHHTATRIKADLYLRYFLRPVEDVVKLYMDELGFDYGTARGQVKAQELMIGYFTCYYYGLKTIQDLQSQLGLDDRTFTEMLFSIPHVSLKTFRGFLELSDDDKRRFLTQFPSLLTY